MTTDPVLTLLLEMLHTAARHEVERESLRASGAGRYQLTDAQRRAERVDLRDQAPLALGEAPETLSPAADTIVLCFS